VPPGALTVDLYELTMADALLAAGDGMAEAPATFSLLVRSLPAGWDRLVAAGLDDVLQFLEGWRFTDEDLVALAGVAEVSPHLVDWLRAVRFRGGVRAVAEGTAVGAQVPVLEVDAPLAVGLLLETALLNMVNVATLLATTCARAVAGAGGRALVDFALRRTHGVDAGRVMARSSWIGGFAATSNVEAAARYGIPASGTMAHALVQAYAGRWGPEQGEEAAFRRFVDRHGPASVLLVDTFDVARGLDHAIAVGRERPIRGVRIDSGDLAAMSRLARDRLDAGGLEEVAVFVSGGLDGADVAALVSGGAPVDGFGVGTRVGVAAEQPWLESIYKLVQCEGRPVRKTSPGKESWPGAKQAWRAADGRTVVELAAAPPPAQVGGAEPLLHEVMRDGGRVGPGATGAGASEAAIAAAARARCAEEWPRPAPRVEPGPALRALLGG
jgi:nicotinate phosphoribosyltransferase